MKYSNLYIDNLYNNIDNFHSITELFCIAYNELKKQKTLPKWYIELREIINWQAHSDRSGVCTYYEVLDYSSSNIVIERLIEKNENKILNVYVEGINRYTNETIMEEIDKWILENEDYIYLYLKNILNFNKDWFYSLK
ncbi:hypothetical protein WS9_013005 [Paraclostridium sordellii 8483]|uniref:hypothetical protein n=1 Tax=Paraclostridium sordellii TaxID=1505 RepID=UPI000305D984|nr:hypothetical protein [Paeniclostridium sordellii]TAN65022.1 hypothetical protein WS9_013005 [Paeniclostridium sordellii 8483]